MNSSERVISLLRFRETDRTPVIPLVAAVTATLNGVSPREYVRSGEVIAQCQLATQRKAGYDCLFAVADLCVEAEALGCAVDYPEDNYPHVKSPILRDGSGMERLTVPDPMRDGRMPQLLKAVRILKAEAAGRVPVVAQMAGPITLASRIMDLEKMLYLIVDHPDRFRELMAFCTRVCTAWAIALLEEGADGLMMIDPASSPSVLPAKIFREFAREPAQSVFSAAKENRPDAIAWYSVAGPLQNNPAILNSIACDIITVDYVVPIQTAFEYAGAAVINGNLKPLLFLEGTPDDIYRESVELLEAARRRERFILGGGCEIPLHSSAENLAALVRASEDQSRVFRKVNEPFKGCAEVAVLPGRERIYAGPGENLLNVLRRSGVGIEGYCSRNGTCGKCRVVVKKGADPGANAAGEQLACHLTVRDATEIYIPYESRVLPYSHATSEEFIQRSISEEIGHYGFSQTIVCVAEDEVRTMPATTSEGWLKDAVPMRPDGEGAASFVVANRESKEFLCFSGSKKTFGIAVDIGTTTISAYLHDLSDGTLVCAGSVENPQNRWGHDVITRTAAIMNEPPLLKEMQAGIMEGIGSLLMRFRSAHGVAGNSIHHMIVVGNPVIIHFFLGLSPERLTRSPFQTEVSGWIIRSAGELGAGRLPVHPRCRIEILPGVGSFIGGDIIAGLLACRLHEREEISLFMDIGTNGEVVIGNRNEILCTSVPAGPAFEGASLAHGHICRNGVITSIRMDERENVEYDTSGSAVPVGLCGSSAIDAIAGLLRNRVINSRGDFVQPGKNPHLVDGRYELLPSWKTALRRPITISRSDIEEIQKAKSALNTAVGMLLSEMGVPPSGIRRVFVSGAFGVSIDVKHAVEIGMIPNLPWAEVTALRNSAGIGARIALLSQRARSEAMRIPSMARYIHLANHPDFTDRFIDNMFFPASRQ